MKYLKIAFEVLNLAVMIANAFFLGAIAHFLYEVTR